MDLELLNEFITLKDENKLLKQQNDSMKEIYLNNRFKQLIENLCSEMTILHQKKHNAHLIVGKTEDEQLAYYRPRYNHKDMDLDNLAPVTKLLSEIKLAPIWWLNYNSFKNCFVIKEAYLLSELEIIPSMIQEFSELLHGTMVKGNVGVRDVNIDPDVFETTIFEALLSKITEKQNEVVVFNEDNKSLTDGSWDTIRY